VHLFSGIMGLKSSLEPILVLDDADLRKCRFRGDIRTTSGHMDLMLLEFHRGILETAMELPSSVASPSK
jgi:hypothetical protein